MPFWVSDLDKKGKKTSRHQNYIKILCKYSGNLKSGKNWKFNDFNVLGGASLKRVKFQKY